MIAYTTILRVAVELSMIKNLKYYLHNKEMANYEKKFTPACITYRLF